MALLAKLKQEIISMEPLKQEVINAISKLPDDAGMEEIMHQLYVLENVRRGQTDAAQGKSSPAEQVLRDIDKW